MPSDSEKMMEAALHWVRLGLGVFPLHYPIPRNGRLQCSCGNPNCQNAAKHPHGRLAPHGLKNATWDPKRVEDFWIEAPYNIGARTGAESGVVIIDVDPRHGGDETLAVLEHQHGELPHTWRFITGSHGEHIVFRHPGVTIKNDAGSRLGQGLDVRGDGGYIVVPPSLHITGRRYAVSVDHDPDDGIVLADMPQWLLGLLRTPERGAAPAAMPETWRKLVAEGVAEGRRNEAVARLAGHLLRKHVDPLVALDLARCWNESRCRPPLPDAELVHTVNSICERELARRGAINAG